MRGIWTALVTPFNSKEELDLPAYRRILQDQKAARVAGVIPCGTTGESPTLTFDERKILVTTALEELKGTGIQVIAGTGTNNTRESVELSNWASNEGVDGILLVTPYYNKPTQAGLIGHFRKIADAVKCEVMLYNVPGRTGSHCAVDTLVQLARHPRINSLKEATGNVAYTSEILDALDQSGQSLDILSGDDASFLPLLSIGAVGVVSVTSNLIPREMVELYHAATSDQYSKAGQIHRRYFPLFKDLFVESNPGPIKFSMEYAGWCNARMREPLVPVSAQTKEILTASLKRCDIKFSTDSKL
jgi:4-hydroxy-tetrahydrodipicolinate synthase